MPERHAELAWRFGEPDGCQTGNGEPGDQRSRWELASPLPTAAGAAEHLAWVAECLQPHEAFVGELISLGGRVVVRLEETGRRAERPFQIDARTLLPLAHAGVLIEWQVD